MIKSQWWKEAIPPPNKNGVDSSCATHPWQTPLSFAEVLNPEAGYFLPSSRFASHFKIVELHNGFIASISIGIHDQAHISSTQTIVVNLAHVSIIDKNIEKIPDR